MSVPPRLIKSSIPVEFLTRKTKPLHSLLCVIEQLASIQRDLRNAEKAVAAAPVSDDLGILAKRVEALKSRKTAFEKLQCIADEAERLHEEVGKQVRYYERSMELAYEQAYLLSKIIPKLQADVKTHPTDADGSPSSLAKVLKEADPAVLDAAAEYRQEILNDHAVYKRSA